MRAQLRQACFAIGCAQVRGALAPCRVWFFYVLPICSPSLASGQSFSRSTSAGPRSLMRLVLPSKNGYASFRAPLWLLTTGLLLPPLSARLHSRPQGATPSRPLCASCWTRSHAGMVAALPSSLEALPPPQGVCPHAAECTTVCMLVQSQPRPLLELRSLPRRRGVRAGAGAALESGRQAALRLPPPPRPSPPSHPNLPCASCCRLGQGRCQRWAHAHT